jgi:linoleoyl-CoA desaturase
MSRVASGPPPVVPVKRPQKVKFPPHSPLRAELNRRVDAYFTDAGISRAAEGPAMWFKTFFLLSGLALSWALLMVWASAWWQLLILAPISGIFAAGIGFCVMHDGSHSAYSESRRWNSAMGAVLDLIGGSSYIWRFKHNVLHHTYPNVEGLDDDIEAQPFLRMAEGQRRYPWHRLQHVYAWLAYAVLPVKWHFIDDFLTLISGKVNGQRMPRPRSWDLAFLLGAKVFFFGWVLVLPLMFRSPEWVVSAYLLQSAFSGIALGTVFQMAHCVEGVEFSSVPESGLMEMPWAEYQLSTTADFAPRSRFLTWFLGGLNYQVEHHLFPRVGHVHYPAVSKIVKEVCAEHGVEHRSQPTLWRALCSHVSFLRRLGRPVTSAPLTP